VSAGFGDNDGGNNGGDANPDRTGPPRADASVTIAVFVVGARRA